jgi:DNA-binding response OmpR family regulator
MPDVLVIDDDIAVSTTVRVVLEHDGHVVTTVHNGRDGMKWLGRDQCDLVIVDIFMPGMDGFETIKVIRALRPQLPILVMSGFMVHSAAGDAPDFLTMATKLGADQALPKPFTASELRKAVSECLASRDPARQTRSG